VPPTWADVCRAQALAQRQASADQIIKQLTDKSAAIPGATLYLQAVQDLRIGGKSSSAQYQYTLQGDNLDDLKRWGPRVLAELRQDPRLTAVNTDQQDKAAKPT